MIVNTSFGMNTFVQPAPQLQLVLTPPPALARQERTRSRKKRVAKVSAVSAPLLAHAAPPYELYLKILAEYFREDLETGQNLQIRIPEGFMVLDYQIQAVEAALKILEIHSGVILADVVGLGKTCIASLILQCLEGRKLVVCPPVLQSYWRQALSMFYVNDAVVISAGKLPDLDPGNYDLYSCVVVDESHRFRNEKTRSYDNLKQLCNGKKVILLSATPYNNCLSDLLAQIKLFQKGRNSTIPGIPNLESFFRLRERELKNIDPQKETDRQAARQCAGRVRELVLRHIMIRRTRTEVMKYFADDLARNNLSFPEVTAPEPLFYQLNEELDAAFEATMVLLQKLHHACYAPFLYYRGPLSHLEQLSQQNIRGFVKSTLVKRLESSFFAFRHTVERIAQKCQAFHARLLNGDFAAVNLDDNPEDAVAISQVMAKKKIRHDEFEPQLLTDLEEDIKNFAAIARLWENVEEDPKFEALSIALTAHPLLANEKVIIFSESAETTRYLYDRLEAVFPAQSLMFSSQLARYGGRNIATKRARVLIRKNFDPSVTDSRDFRILITTDVLAEGMNLHRAGRLINYDLPWNPTRIMQRLGRINRVGAAHKKLCIFNFFPTSRADAHLGLQSNANRKLTAFNAVLGNDSKILFENELPNPHQLFQKLNTLQDDEDESPDLEYLRFVQKFRADNPEYFAKIGGINPQSHTVLQKNAHSLLLFFRHGLLRRFVLATADTVRELTFLEAVNILKTAVPSGTTFPLPRDSMGILNRAMSFLKQYQIEFGQKSHQNRSTSDLLNAIQGVRKFQSLSETDQTYLQNLEQAIAQAAISKNRIAAFVRETPGNFPTPQHFVAALRGILPESALENSEKDWQNKRDAAQTGQLILAFYF